MQKKESAKIKNKSALQRNELERKEKRQEKSKGNGEKGKEPGNAEQRKKAQDPIGKRMKAHCKCRCKFLASHSGFSVSRSDISENEIICIEGNTSHQCIND